MNIYPISKTRRISWGLGLAGLVVLAGCGSVPSSLSSEELTSRSAPAATADSTVAGESSPKSSLIPTPSAQPIPSLVKHAALQVELADVDAAIEAISATLGQYQGDLLQLIDEESQTIAPRHVNLTLRVPQDNLEPVLQELRALGTVVNQSVMAEDVSTQLVDLRARVRNLRQSEAALLEIMERSGSIADVLEVTRELSTVREAIERHEAQLQNLQNRVAYSTVTLTLISTQPPVPATSPVGETLSQTWQTARTSVKTLSVSLLRLLLWLLAYSPYIALLVLLGWLVQRYRLRRSTARETVNPS